MKSILLLWIASAVVLHGCVATGDGPGELGDRDGRFELFVLGIAQDGGLPHLGCQKACCTEARAKGRALYPACLGVVDRETGRKLLIEVTPAVEAQVALLDRLSGVPGAPRRPADAVLITHAHIGHYSGLVHFGREVASTAKIPVHVSERMAGFLRNNSPWSQLVELQQIELRTVTPGTPVTPLPGLEVTAFSVPHRDEFSDTLAFRLRGSHHTVLFVPDIDRWGDTTLEELLDGVDVAYLDATFFDGRELPGRDLSEIPHPLMVQTMERLGERAARNPGRIRFIHLNHTNPALHDPDLRHSIRDRGFRVAQQGERVRF